jgi:hypothetical protein
VFRQCGQQSFYFDDAYGYWIQHTHLFNKRPKISVSYTCIERTTKQCFQTGECKHTRKMVGRSMVLVVVTELLRRDGLAKVKGERLEHILLGVCKGRGLGGRERVGKRCLIAHDCCERVVGGWWLVLLAAVARARVWYEGGSATRVSVGRTMHSFHSCVGSGIISQTGQGAVCTRTGWLGFVAKQ